MGSCIGKNKDYNSNKVDKDDTPSSADVRPITGSGTKKFSEFIVKDLKAALGDVYDVDKEELGHAAMGCNVRKVIHKPTGTEYACKTFHISCVRGKKKQKSVRKMLRNEIEVVKSLDHPNIIRGKEIREDQGNLHFIMELCRGNHLGCYKYTEIHACAVVKSLLRAIIYVHSNGIVHRDLKMENVLWDDGPKQGRIKIIDFGMSTHFMDGDLMSDRVGTPYTMAPEVFTGAYSEKADIWSIGAMTFHLIAGSPAFEMPELENTIKRIMSVSYYWPANFNVSSEAKEFVYHMLKFDPNKRWTLQQALESRWIRKYDKEICMFEELSLTLQPNAIPRIVESMRDYNTYSMFKKAVLLVMAVKIEPSRMRVLSDAFVKFDKDLSGKITMDEMKQLLSQSPDVSDEEAAEVFNAVDINNTGEIQFLEFLAATCESIFSLDELGNHLDEGKLKEVFEFMDIDSSGEISVQNMCTLFGDSVSKQEVIKIMNGIRDMEDTYSHDSIDYTSFLKLFCSPSHASHIPTSKAVRIDLTNRS